MRNYWVDNYIYFNQKQKYVFEGTYKIFLRRRNYIFF